jgi:hypothetical protein
VALARAAYSPASAFLLDDPLSAVDPRVGQVLFDKCIGNTGLLQGVCCVLCAVCCCYVLLLREPCLCITRATCF